MHIETLAPATKKLLLSFNNVDFLKEYYLAGGTALALHYGHRQSIDLDWFTKKSINVPVLAKSVSKFGKFTLVNESENTLEGILQKVKISFMTYPYTLLKKPILLDSIRVAHPYDIATMKIGAITGRNTKKDFIDLYVFLQREKVCLDQVIGWYTKKAKGIVVDEYHIYKSLTYFREANNDAMPKMFEPLVWETVKKFFVSEVKKLSQV